MPTTTRDWLERELDCLRKLVERQRELLADSWSEPERRQLACELKELEDEAIRLACVLANLKMSA